MGTSLKLTVPASTLTCALCAGGWFLRATMVLTHAAGQLLVELPRQPLPLLPPQLPAHLWRQPALQTPRSGMSPKLPGPFGPNAFHGPLHKSPALTVCKLGGTSSCCPRPCSAPLLVAGAGTACKQPSSLSVVVPVGWPENAKSCGMPCLPLAANGLRRWMMRKPGQPGRAAAAHWPPRASSALTSPPLLNNKARWPPSCKKSTHALPPPDQPLWPLVCQP
jgi:hypothetical protein